MEATLTFLRGVGNEMERTSKHLTQRTAEKNPRKTKAFTAETQRGNENGHIG
jgi:hypothetical protein